MLLNISTSSMDCTVQFRVKYKIQTIDEIEIEFNTFLVTCDDRSYLRIFKIL